MTPKLEDRKKASSIQRIRLGLQVFPLNSPANYQMAAR